MILTLGHSPETKILDFESVGSNCLVKMVILEENDPTLTASKLHFEISYGLEIARHDRYMYLILEASRVLSSPPLLVCIPP